jgi:hypothetical protein
MAQQERAAGAIMLQAQAREASAPPDALHLSHRRRTADVAMQASNTLVNLFRMAMYRMTELFKEAAPGPDGEEATLVDNVIVLRRTVEILHRTVGIR